MRASKPLLEIVQKEAAFFRTKRYGPLCRPTSSSCGGLRTSAEGFFCPAGKKMDYAVLANFWPILVFSSNLSNF